MGPKSKKRPCKARVALTPAPATTRTSTPSPNAAIGIVVNKAATLVIAYEGLNLGRSGRACSGENQLRQGWDCVGAGDVQSRAEVIPKSNAQFEASFCQAQESVSAIATGVTAGAATDLSPCDLTANVIFRSVGVERDFGTVEHHEQLGLVFV